MIPLELTDAALTTERPLNLTQQTMKLIISNEEMEDILKIVKTLENSGLIIKGASKTTENKANKQNNGFLDILLSTLGVIRTYASRHKCYLIRWGNNQIRTGFLTPPHPLTNFEMQRYYQNESNFNGVYSKNNLPKIKDGAYVINLDKYKSIGAHWIALYLNGNNVTHFCSFGLEYVSKEIKLFIGNIMVKGNI